MNTARGHDLLDRVRHYGLRIYCLLVFVFLLFPVFLVIPISLSKHDYVRFPPTSWSFSNFGEVLSTPAWLAAIGNSLLIGLLSTALASLLGTGAALGLAHGNFRGKATLTGLLLAPLVVPTLLWGLGMFFWFHSTDWIGSYLGMVIAHTVLATPFVVVVVWASLKQIDRRLIQAAKSLGADPANAFGTITLPLIVPGIVAGALIAFIMTVGDVILALYLAGAEYTTLPLAMFEGLHVEVDPLLAAVATLFILATGAVLLIVEQLHRRANQLWGIES